MTFKQKLSNFFIPMPTVDDSYAEASVDSFLTAEVEGQSVVNQFSDINKELWQLMELGEFEKVIELSRKYNYFNQYPSLGLYVQDQGDYALLSDILSELVAGPLYAQLSNYMEADSIPELYFINRTLYLADYAQQQFVDSSVRKEGVDTLLKVFAKNEDFQDFIERFHTKLAQVPSGQRQDYLNDTLIKHLTLNVEKLHADFDLRNNSLSVSEEELEQYQLVSLYLENNLAELIEYSLAPVNQKPSYNYAILQVARENLHRYLTESQPAHYPTSQAKMDIIELSKVMSSEGVHSLARRFGILDFYPMLAQQYMQTHDYQHSMSIILDFIEQSKIFQSNDIFEQELIKEQLLDFIYCASRHLNKMEHDLCQSFLRETMSPVYLEKLRNMYAAPVEYLDLDKFNNVAVVPLLATSKNIFNKN